MKNLLKMTTVTVLLFLFTMTGMASETEITLKPGNDPKSLIFEMVSPSAEATISLVDVKNQSLLYKNISVKSSIITLNLKKLETGTYYLRADDPAKSVIYTIHVTDNSVIIANKEETLKKQVFRKEGDKVYFNLMNNDLSRVHIKIIDGQDRELYRKSVKGELVLGEVFNFEKAYKDTYTIVVKDGQVTWSQDIEIL